MKLVETHLTLRQQITYKNVIDQTHDWYRISQFNNIVLYNKYLHKINNTKHELLPPLNHQVHATVLLPKIMSPV